MFFIAVTVETQRGNRYHTWQGPRFHNIISCYLRHLPCEKHENKSLSRVAITYYMIYRTRRRGVTMSCLDTHLSWEGCGFSQATMEYLTAKLKGLLHSTWSTIFIVLMQIKFEPAQAPAPGFHLCIIYLQSDEVCHLKCITYGFALLIMYPMK